MSYKDPYDIDPMISEEMKRMHSQASQSWSKYHREIKAGVFVDVYDVIQAWGVKNPALQHLIKKALQAGNRGHKNLATDLQDIIDSAKRAKELENELR